MPKSKSKVSANDSNAKVPSDDLVDIFGDPPLIYGEDKEAYLSLKARLFSSVRPGDIIEQIWVYDVLNLIWEAQRLRRLKASLMKAASHEGLRKLLGPLVSNGSAFERLIKEFARNDAEGVEVASTVLATSDLDQGSIDAQILVMNLDAFERIDEMIARIDARRDLVLNEIERRRDLLARRLREAASAIEDAEFREMGDSHQEAAE